MTIFGVASKKLFLSLEKNHLEDKYLVMFCGAMTLYSVALALMDTVTTRPDHSLPNRQRSLIRGGVALFFLMLTFRTGRLSPLILVVIAAVIMIAQISVDLVPQPSRGTLPSHPADD